MINALRLKTLDSRIYFTFTLLVFIMIIIMQLFSYYSASITIRKGTIISNRTLLNRLVNQLDSYILDMELIIENVKSIPELSWILAEEDGVNDRKLQKALKVKLRTYNKAREDISSVALFGYNGQIVLDSGIESLNASARFNEATWYKGAEKQNGTPFVSSSYVQNLIDGKYSWVVSISREIRNRGIILIDLKFNRIQELCDSLSPGKKGYVFIVDSLGNYVYHPSQQLVYSGIKSEPVQSILLNDSFSKEGKIYLTTKSEKTGWYICSVSYEDELMKSWRKIQYYNVIIGLIAFIIVGIATTFISQSITRPVLHLCETMKSVETGEFVPIGEIKATNEISALAREYDIMIGKINELMERIVSEQESKRKSDLKALQAQINPHFLYNTLDSIIWMGEMGKSDEVVKMTSALSKLFRISISRGKEIISIADEIHHVTSYLTIQEMRYKDKFTYQIDIDDELLQCKILKITLQPLVENAIYHGIKSVDYEGLIIISGYKEKDRVILTVSDNGKGIKPEEFDAMLNNSSNLSNQGTGVRNVHGRIQLYFGEQYGLQCSNIEGRGTKISVILPLIDEVDPS